MSSFRFLVVWILLCSLFLSGCSQSSGGQQSASGASGNQVVTQSNTFELKSNVKILPDETQVQVLDLQDGSVTLTGAIPTLQVGDVISRSEGNNQFLRRITTITNNGAQTLIQTEKVVLTDVFQSASIHQTVFLGPEFLETLQPGIPGVTFGKPEQVLAKAEEFAAFSLPVHFGDAVIGSNARGSVVADGDISIRLALEKDLQIGVKNFVVPTVNHFALIPQVTVVGKLALKGSGSGDFRQEFPLTGKFSYPLAGFGPVSLNLAGQLILTVDGYVQSEGTLSFSGGVTLRAGVESTADQWRAIGEATPEFTVEAPQLTATARLNASLVEPRLSINLLDMGEVFVNANVLRLEVEADAINTGYNVKVFRTFSVEAGAHIALGVAPLVVRYDGLLALGDTGRTLVKELGVPLPVADSRTFFAVVIPLGENPGPLKTGEQRLYLGLSYINVGNFLLIPIPAVGRWSSSAPGVGTVQDFSFFGLATAQSPGSFDVIYRTSGVEGTFRQAVSGTLQGIQLVGTGLNFRGDLRARQLGPTTPNVVGERETLLYKAIGTYSDGSQADLTYSVNWTTSNDKSAVFRNGQFNGRLEGVSDLIANYRGVKAQTPVTIARPAIETLYITPLSPTTAEVTTGSTLKLRAAARFKDNTIRDVTNFAQWLSLDPSVATVSFGVVTPKKAGLTAILAYDGNGFAYEYKYVQVNKAVMTGLEVQPKTPSAFKVGATQQFSAVATYADGDRQDVSGLVNWFNSNEGLGSLSSQGLYRFSGQGRARVKAFYNGFTGSTDTFECRGPAGLRFVAQPANVAPGQPFTLDVDVLDANNQPWTDPLSVTLELGAGSPSNSHLQGTLTRTSSAGRARFANLTVDQVGGGYTIRALSSGLSVAESQPFAGTAANNTLAIPTPVTVQVNQSLAPLNVQVTDPQGNPINGVNVSLAIGNGPVGGVLGGTTQRNSAAGVASFTNLTFSAAGNYTLTASATGFTSATSAAFTIAPAVNQLSVVVQPTSTLVGTPVTLQLVLKDNLNQPLAVQPVTVSLGNNPVGAVLSGTTTVNTDANGVANFSAPQNLRLDKAGTGFTLVATGPVGANVTTAPFNITLPTLTVTSQPTATQVGSNLTLQFTLLDGANPVSNSAVNLTIGTNPGGGLLTGVTSVLTDANGVANFTSAQITVVGVGYTLVGGTGAVTAITNPFNVTPLPKGFIFAAGSSGNFIVTTPYNTTTGANGTQVVTDLTANVQAGLFPSRLLVTRDKKFLISSNGDKSILVMTIDPTTGALGFLPNGRTVVSNFPGEIQQSPNNPNLFYVPVGAQDIQAFTLNPTTGAMTSVLSPSNILPATANPRELEVLDVGGSDMVYVADTFANGVSAIKVNPTTFAVISNTFVTAGFNVGTFIGPTSLAITNVGGQRQLQVLNQDENAVYGFPIQADGSIGTLTNTSNGTVAATSRNLSTSPSGAAFYAGNQNSQLLTVYNATVPPTNPVLVTNSLATDGRPFKSDLQGNLYFVLTSPEKNVDIFLVNADETLTRIAGPLLMTSGGSNIQDIKTVVLP